MFDRREDVLTSTFDTRTPSLAQTARGETKRTLFAPEDVIQAYPGPAFLVARDGSLLFANAQASDLVAAALSAAFPCQWRRTSKGL